MKVAQVRRVNLAVLIRGIHQQHRVCGWGVRDILPPDSYGSSFYPMSITTITTLRALH